MNPHHPKRILPRWSAAALAALLAAGAADALPLDPSVTRELNFLSRRANCPQGLPLLVDPVTCVVTQDDALVAGPYTDPNNASVSGSARAYANGLDVSVLATSAASTGEAWLDAVQFDQLTVRGPTPTVQVGVKVTVTGTTVQSSPYNYVLTVYDFIVGPRAASSYPGTNVTGDRIDGNQRSVLDFARTASLSRGVIHPTIANIDYGSFTATTGTPFEYGFELVVDSMNTAMDFSARVEYSLPAGYTLTSTRGLAVNVIPEPAGWALMLAGLAGLGLLRACRTRPGNVPCRPRNATVPAADPDAEMAKGMT